MRTWKIGIRILSINIVILLCGGDKCITIANNTNVLTMEECIKIAIENHPQLKVVKENIKISQSRVAIVKAQWIPQVSFEISYNHIDAVPVTYFRNELIELDTEDNYDMRIILKQNIYDGGRTSAQVLSAKLNVYRFQEEYRRIKDSVISNVKQAYYDILKAKSVMQLNKEILRLTEVHLELAQSRYQIGVSPKIDVIRGKVEVSNAKLNLIRAQNAVDLARATLRNAMGVDVYTDIQINESFLPISPKRERNVEKCIKLAYNHRPEVNYMELNIRMVETKVSLANSNRLPHLKLESNYGWQNDEFPSNNKYKENDYYSIGIIANISIFEGGSIKAQIVESKAELAQAKAKKVEVMQNIALEVNQAYLNFKEAEERIKTTKETVSEAQENLRLANVRYEAGKAPFVEVTDAQVTYTTTQTNYIQAIYDYNVSWVILEKVMGMVSIER